MLVLIIPSQMLFQGTSNLVIKTKFEVKVTLCSDICIPTSPIVNQALQVIKLFSFSSEHEIY